MIRLVAICGNRMGVYECKAKASPHLIASFVDENHDSCTDAAAVEAVRTDRYEPLGDNDPM